MEAPRLTARLLLLAPRSCGPVHGNRTGHIEYIMCALVGVVLVSVLRWEDKVGLLFAVWMTGEY